MGDSEHQTEKQKKSFELQINLNFQHISFQIQI